MAPLIATLAYQLIQAIPETSDDILQTIERNPLIFTKSLEVQLQQLIIDPLLRLSPELQRLFVVFIDGLDECSDRGPQSNMIKVLGDVSHSKNIPVIFLVAARREPQIEAAFRHKPVAALLRTLSLDQISAANDIKRFLNNKFKDIKETHLHKGLLPSDWPATSVVEEIVGKSSGQFIFTSVVISYISSPRANPSAQLEVIRGIRVRDPSSQNPFVQLDALYQHIFSQVEALDKVFEILAFVLLRKGNGIDYIQGVFQLEGGDINVLFADLAAVIECEPGIKRNDSKLKFLHASLPDFLLDKSRSGRYHIDTNESRTKLLCMLLERPPPTLNPLWSADDLNFREQSRLYEISHFLGEAKASERLCSAFMNFHCTFYTKNFLDGWNYLSADILRSLSQLVWSTTMHIRTHKLMPSYDRNFVTREKRINMSWTCSL